jgi:hypothetical protein
MSANEGEGASRTTTIGAFLAATAVALAAAAFVLVVPASAATRHVGVGFNAPSISGFPATFPAARCLSWGGAYDPKTASNAEPEHAFVHSSGGFRCLEPVAQGPLKGCLAGEGVRWDTDGLLESTRASSAPAPRTSPRSSP